MILLVLEAILSSQLLRFRSGNLLQSGLELLNLLILLLIGEFLFQQILRLCLVLASTVGINLALLLCELLR